MPITIDGSNGITQAGEFNSDSTFGFKNRIINGAMVIDQRNAGASFSSSTNGAYNLDRWYNQNNSGGTKFTVQQNAGSVTPPSGFKNYLGVTSTSAYSVASSDVIGIGQYIEGFNVADLNWGAANAQTVTLSFWVRSSLTGTFGGSLNEANAGTAYYPYTYTISSANTWEYKTVTVVGPTIGTWQTGNLRGINVLFNLGTGSTYSGTAGSWSASSYYAPTGATSVVGTNGATFYITGVQLEVGSTATSFDYRPYGTELALCQRYYEITSFVTMSSSSGGKYQSIDYKATKRASPTLTKITSDAAVTITVEVGLDATASYYQSGFASTDTRITYSASAEL
jgi:hypothetical protein